MARQHLKTSFVTLLFGVCSTLLPFLDHLVSLALILALLAAVMGSIGAIRIRRAPKRYTQKSQRMLKWGWYASWAGLVVCTVVWILFRQGIWP